MNHREGTPAAVKCQGSNNGNLPVVPGLAAINEAIRHVRGGLGLSKVRIPTTFCHPLRPAGLVFRPANGTSMYLGLSAPRIPICAEQSACVINSPYVCKPVILQGKEEEKEEKSAKLTLSPALSAHRIIS